MFVRYRIFFCHCRSDRFVGTGEEGRHITHHGRAQEQVSAGSLFRCLILAWDHVGKDLAEQREAMVGAGEMLQCECWEEQDPTGVGPSLPTAGWLLPAASFSWIGGSGGKTSQWSFSLWPELVTSATSA